MKIPFYKPAIAEAEVAEVIDTMRSGWLTTGAKTRLFEQEFAAYVAQKHAVALNSCTAALHLALEAVGLKAGDVAVVPTMTFAATAEVVRYFNATPLLVDCRESDFNMDTVNADSRIEQALARGEKVVAILPVHYGGQIGEVAGVTALARRFNLKIIEDAAHCCPAYYRQSSEIGDQRSDVRDRKSDVRGQMPEVGGQKSDVGNQKSEAGDQTSEARDQKSDIRDQRSETRSQKSDPPSALRLDVESSKLKVGCSMSVPSDVRPPTSDFRSPSSDLWSPVGSSSDIACFSFYANKCITTGEGGMACTQRADYAERMRVMSLHGISKDAWKRFTAEGSWYYEIVAPGFKYNLTDIAAAIGLHQLRRADELHRKRSALANLYSQLLADVEEIILPTEQPNRIHSWHLYVIRLKLDQLTIDRANVIESLKQAGITTSVHWMPLHMHPYYREKYGYKPEDFPVAARLYPEIITLPLYPDMTEPEVTYVCDTLKQIIAAHPRVVRVMPRARPKSVAA